MTYQGLVEKQKVNHGSKQEHAAVVLKAPEGTFKLRRQGGNPFVDETLEQLVGKTIECEGVVINGSLFLSKWGVI
jgi:hypothetical protein